jgi:hypothetical protein
LNPHHETAMLHLLHHGKQIKLQEYHKLPLLT